MQKLLFIYMLATLVACNNKSLLTTLEEEQTELATKIIATTDKSVERFTMEKSMWNRSAMGDYYKEFAYLADTAQQLKITFFTRLDSYDYATSNYSEVTRYVDSMVNGILDFVDSSRIDNLVPLDASILFSEKYLQWKYYKEGVQRITNDYNSSLTAQRLRITPTTERAWNRNIAVHKMLYVRALQELQELLGNTGRNTCHEWNFIVSPGFAYTKAAVGEIYRDSLYIILACPGERMDSMQLFINDSLVKKGAYEQVYSVGEYIDTKALGLYPLKVEVLMRDIEKGWIHYGQKMYEYEVVE